jgi:hypothetical protein
VHLEPICEFPKLLVIKMNHAAHVCNKLGSRKVVRPGVTISNYESS